MFVSRAMAAVEERCDVLVWIDQGRIRMSAESQTVIGEYQTTG